MKTAYSVKLLITGMVTAAILSSFRIGSPARSMDRARFEKNTGKWDGKGFAVLELFTSEGCSSCPPADELMAGIQKETEGKSVYILAYHVDYWDRLGWKDAFSSAEYSNRQLQYSRWLNVSPIYTPQVIVNGKMQYVGSETSAIHHAISEQLTTKPVSTLTIQAYQEGEHLQLTYRALQVHSGSHILIAIIQKAAQTKVLRGENAGRLLAHIQIVRKLQSERLGTAGEGSASIELPKDFNAQNWEVLCFVQDQSNGGILAVTRANL